MSGEGAEKQLEFKMSLFSLAGPIVSRTEQLPGLQGDDSEYFTV